MTDATFLLILVAVTFSPKMASDWGAEDYRPNPADDKRSTDSNPWPIDTMPTQADNCSSCGHHAKYHHTDSNRPGYSECSATGCNCDCLTLSPGN